MQKKILTICFIISLGLITNAMASVTSITAQNPVEAMKDYNRLPPNSVNPPNLPNPNNQEEVREFFKERFEKAARMETDEPIDLTSPSSIGIMHSPEYYEQEAEKKKTLFQKMYEKAVASLHETQPDQQEEQIQQEEELERTATRFFKLMQQDEQINEEVQIPTVSVALPSGRRVLAPAQEHIPYLLSYINIEANGYLKIEDTIIIVANGNKFAHGLQRVFNKYAQKGQKTEFILQSVTVNGTQIPYIAEEIGSQIILKPKHNQKLEPGVYTYKFSYMVNNQLVRIQDRNYLFHWNLTGVPLNALITSANAIISIPEGHTFTDIKLYIGEGKMQNTKRTNTYRLAGNVMAFASNTPVLNGENTVAVGVLDKNIFLKDFDKNFSSFLINWGSILYATLGFLAISLSLMLSLITLKKNKGKNKFNPSYNGALMRTVLIGKYDRIAFVSQILDLYRKGCLDIVQESNRIFLEKQQHYSSKLTKAEKRIMSVLFAKKSPRTEINNTNNNRFKRAQKILDKSVTKTLNKYRLIHNIGYLLFSVAMLLCTLIFIAANSINMAQSVIILLATALLYAFYIWIVLHKFKRWYITVPIKVWALLSILIIWIFSSIYVGGITSAIIAATILVIFIFLQIFAEYNNFINEAKEIISRYKDYLQANAESINLSRTFLNQQSNIFALGISEYFPQNVSNKNYYKLDSAENLRQALIGIL